MIHDRNALAVSEAHATALDCLEAGIEAARPKRVLRETVDYDGERLTVGTATHDLSAYDEVIVLGGGNAAAHLAAAIEDELGDALDGGLVVTDDPVETSTVDVLRADHPVPSERGMTSTQTLLDRARSADEDTLVLGVVTGGGSACLVAPADRISLADLRATTEALLESGVDIHEINAVRKHLSGIKGGGLARALAPARVSTLVLSDVVGDDRDVIASGPVVPDSSTFADALNVIEREEIAVPAAVQERLAAGAAGGVDETPGPEDPAFARVDTHLIGTNLTALRAARTVAEDRGYETTILSSRIRGEARDAAMSHVAVAEEIAASGNPVEPPAVVLSGGETTVSVDGDGRGGPNQEFALAAAIDLPDDTVLGAVDTDGIDGNTDAAGAVVDGTTVTDASTARQALTTNDANAFLADRGALIETGPTGTNVNDLRVLVVE